MCTPYITQCIIRLHATCSNTFSTFLFHLFPFDISLLPFRKAAIIWYMVNKELLEAYTTALLDHTHSSNPFYRPSFLFNDPKENRKVLSTIEDELRTSLELMLLSNSFHETGPVHTSPVLCHRFSGGPNLPVSEAYSAKDWS